MRAPKRFPTLVLLMLFPWIPYAGESAEPGEPEDVAVQKVVLFSSGVGYFEHTGTVEDNAEVELKFKTEQINDLLKSLILQDLDGGRVTSAVYPSQDPIAKTLKSFQVDISNNPTLGQLLSQLRGASVSIETLGQSLEGTILGVETKDTIVGDHGGIVKTWLLNLFSGSNFRTVALDEVQSIKLQDDSLQQELNQALAALAQSRDQDKKPVLISFEGQGERRVRLAYVVETPVWKTSYRLILSPSEGDSGTLQGWAIVENQTDNDWENVQLSLVSGRPISFIQDLYQPLYIPRPVVEPELYASLKPQRYTPGMDVDEGSVSFGADRAISDAARVRRKSGEMREEAQYAMVPGGFSGSAMEAPFDPTAGVSSLAAAGEIGELFQYVVGDVSLPRRRSAMIPIVTDEIKVRRVSIYNQQVLAKHPLNGARIENTSGKHLLQGPVTVFDDHTYAGDAQIGNLPPAQERLISYAIDLQVDVDATQNTKTNHIQTGRIVKGVLEVKRKYVHSQEYRIKNNSGKDKTVVVEHPLRPGWDLFDSPKPIETTENLYRFEDALSADESAKLVVNLEQTQSETVALLSSDLGPLVFYSRNGNIPQQVRDALAKAITMKQELVDTQRRIDDLQNRISEITQEQSRIRSNMSSVNRNSDYYNRLLKKLNDQETEIEKLRMQIDDLRETLEAQRHKLEDYLSNLTVE